VTPFRAGKLEAEAGTEREPYMSGDGVGKVAGQGMAFDVRLPSMTLPFEDVRVISIEQFGAGPWATMQLADLGAEVIKIEDPRSGGDVGRYVPPFQEEEDSLFFETFNRNKHSVALDLRHPRARGVLEDLVRGSDAVFSNLRGDRPAKLGLRYAELAAINPLIVCCSLSGFGMTGPRAAEGGYDYVIQGLAGWMTLTGEPGAPPTKTGLSLVDLSAGYVAALAIVAGVWRAHRDGVGCDCDISLFDTALAELMYVGTWAATKGYQAPRHANSAHPSIVPFQNFATADGWIVIACPKEHLWRTLCEAIDRPELAADPRFASFAKRDRNRGDLLPALDAAFAAQPTDDWLARLVPAGIPCARVNDVLGALDDPQAYAREAIVEVPHDRFGVVRTIATPLRVGSDRRQPVRAPRRGEHTRECLARVCGYSDERFAELAESGVFGEAVDGAAADTEVAAAGAEGG
jgi:crotonobetainyl-CoA:carnitine CoA-transferase CaiB-like acyl-CoA transferase